MKKQTLLLILFFLSISAIKAQLGLETRKIVPDPYALLETSKYGISVAVDGNLAVVGSLDEGVTILYNNGITWEKADTIQTSDVMDNFGSAVSISGNIIVIGSPANEDNGIRSGVVFIYEIDTTDSDKISTTKIARLSASDVAPYDYFGRSLGIYGNTVVVGAPFDDDNGDNSGLVYVFEKPETGWTDMTETTKLSASDADSDDLFGSSISIFENTIAIGAANDNQTDTTSGSVYLFEKPSSGWTYGTETAKLTVSSCYTAKFFGRSVALSESAVIIGAGDYVKGTASGAYIYEKPETGWINMTETAKLTASTGTGFDGFGSSVGISGNTVIVGAMKETHTRYGSSGTAYIFEKSETGWFNMNETAKLTPTDGTSHFGKSVAISADYAIIGAPSVHTADPIAGSAYVFQKPETGWSNSTETFKTLGPGLQSTQGILFGSSVSIDGNYAVVGGPGYLRSEGIAYVLYFNGENWETVAHLEASDGEDSFRFEGLFGYSVSISGNTIVVGAIKLAEFDHRTGNVYVFEKPATGWKDMKETAKLTPSYSNSTLKPLQFGRSVDISDGTIVVGAYGNVSVYVFEKPTTGWVNMTQTTELKAWGASANGISVGISNNTIVAGDQGINSKSAYIFEKPVTGWADIPYTAKLTASDVGNGGRLGFSVGIIGNTVVAGSYNNAAYAFEKPVSGWANMTETAKLTTSGEKVFNNFGRTVNISGNKIVVGSGDNSKGNNARSVFVFEKPATGWTDITESTIIKASDGGFQDNYGCSVGISDDKIIVGASHYDGTDLDAGSAYLYKLIHPISIITQPISLENVCPYDVVDFKVSGKKIVAYQWQVSNDAGITYDNITDGDFYEGANSSNLTFVASKSVNNNLYRCILSNKVYSDTTSSAAFTIDTIKPIITSTHADQIVIADSNCEAILPDYTADLQATDNCDSITITQLPAAGTIISGKVNFVKLIAEDYAGNIDSVTFVVAAKDEIKPQVNCVANQNVYISVEEGAYMVSGSEFDPLSSKDNCGIYSTTNDFNIAVTLDSAKLPLGTTTVVWTALDYSGNSETCSTEITVIAIDTIAPVITSTHADQIVEANSNCEALLKDYTTEVISSDNSDTVIINQKPVPGTIISGELNTVVLIAQDNSRNADSVSFNVEVNDATKPSINCIGDQTIGLPSGEENYIVSGTEFDPLNSEDNCGILKVINNFNNLSTLDSAVLSLGTTIIEWSALDYSGNKETCITKIIVNRTSNVESLVLSGVSVYPNPVSDVLRIELNGNAIQRLELMDFTGKILMQESEILDSRTFNMSSYKQGVYLLNIIIDNKSYTTRIIKK